MQLSLSLSLSWCKNTLSLPPPPNTGQILISLHVPPALTVITSIITIQTRTMRSRGDEKSNTYMASTKKKGCAYSSVLLIPMQIHSTEQKHFSFRLFLSLVNVVNSLKIPPHSLYLIQAHHHPSTPSNPHPSSNKINQLASSPSNPTPRLHSSSTPPSYPSSAVLRRSLSALRCRRPLNRALRLLRRWRRARFLGGTRGGGGLCFSWVSWKRVRQWVLEERRFA